MIARIGLEAVWQDANFRAGVSNYVKSVGQATTATDKATSGISKSGQEIGRTWEEAAQKVGTAMTVLGASLVAASTAVVLVAARNEELGVVLETVGRNAGYTADEMYAYEDGVKAMGITTAAARQALVQMTQADVDLAQATDLARLAQDAAVIAQLDSSQALEQLITGTQRGSIVMLRQLGINVQFEDSYKEMALALGKNVDALTDQERQQARVNIVLKAGEAIAGTYEAAMGTAGKQLRSMNRHVQELADEFGQALLPTMSSVVEGATDLLKGFRELPDPLKATIAQVGAMSGGLLTLGGAALLIVPKIQAAITVLKSLQLVAAVGLGPLGLMVTALAALGAGAVYLYNLEKAHREEAAAILAASKNYKDYIEQLDAAGLSSYAFSESLYEVVESAEAAGEAIDALALQNAKENLENLITAHKSYIETLRTGLESEEEQVAYMQMFQEAVAGDIRELSNLELVVASNYGQMRQLAESMGLTGEAADELAQELVKVAKKEQGLRELTDIANRAVEPWQEMAIEAKKASSQVTGLTFNLENLHGISSKMAEIFKRAAEALDVFTNAEARAGEMSKALVAAIDLMYQRYANFTGVLASGIVQLRDLDQAAAESATSYGKSLADLEVEAGRAYGSIRQKYQESLPDPTSVQERLGMMGDAWDEWGLRFQDIINQGVASPWYQTLLDMGYEKPPDVGITEWVQGLKDAFYEGDLEGLINKDSQAWKDHAAALEEAQSKETAAVAASTAAKRKALKEAYDEQQRLAQEAREQAVLQLALQTAEERGQLQAWAEQRFGAYAGVADSAAEVGALIESGMLTVDETLAGMIEGNAAGLLGILESTAGIAETNQAAMSEVYQQALDASQTVQDAATEVDSMQQKLEGMEGIIAMFPEEDQQAVRDGLMEVGTSVDTLKTQADSDPFAGLLTSFTDAKDAMVADAKILQKDITDSMQDMSEDTQTALWAILDVWSGHSVIPDMIEAAEGLGSDWDDLVGDMMSIWNNITDRMTTKWRREIGYVIQRVRDFIIELDKIPREITVNIIVTTTYAGAPPTPGAPVVPGVPGPENSGDYFAGWGTAIGAALGDALVDAIGNNLKELMQAGGSLSGLGKFFGNLFEEQTLDPLAERLEEIDARMEELGRGGLLTGAGIAEMAALEEERVGLAAEYAAQQEKILALQQAQQDLDFLSQQSKLLELIQEYGLDAGEILGGMELGLGASVEDLMAAMTAAMQAIIAQAEDELGIHSESTVFKMLGRQMMAGLAQGVQETLYAPVQATSAALMAPVQAAQLMAPSGPMMNLNFGGVTINNGMDMTVFEARVTSTVRRALYNG